MTAFFVKIDCFLCEILIGSSPYPINKHPTQIGAPANKMKIIWKHWKRVTQALKYTFPFLFFLNEIISLLDYFKMCVNAR